MEILGVFVEWMFDETPIFCVKIWLESFLV